MPLTPFDIPPASHLIDGAWIRDNATIQVTDPSTGAHVTEIARGTSAPVDRAVGAARSACDGVWGRMTALERL